MGLFKSKYDKLSREEVVESIIQLEKELSTIEEGLVLKKQEIDALLKKGSLEVDRDMKIFYAKKINFLKAERQQNVQRCMYLLYNIQLMNKLKMAIDDNQLFKKSSKMSLGNLLSDQKGLAKFLNKTLNTKVKAEQVLTDSDELFTEIMSTVDPNETIYGTNNQDEELLSMFETVAQVNDEIPLEEENTIEEELGGEQ